MIEKQDTQRLQFLYQAARAISTQLSTNEVLQRLMVLTHHHFQPDAVSVAQVEHDGSLVFCAASGKSAQQIVGLRIESGTGIVGWVAEHGEPLWVPDVYKDPRFYPNPDQETGFRTVSILAAPVKLGDQILAVLEMINPTPDTNLDEARQVLTALASLAARAIQNARLFEQVQRAEARYQSLFEQNLDPIIIVDREANLLEINHAAKHLLSQIPQIQSTFSLETLGLSLAEFDGLKTKIKSGEVATWEFKVRQGDVDARSEERILEVKLSYLPDYPPQGAYQWLAHDITDRVVLEEMRQNLSNMIVHDLRAPLGSVINSLELLLTAWRDKDITIPIEQVLKIGLRSAHRMERLISTILDTARLQANEKTLQIIPIDIPKMIEEVLEVVQSAADRRQHKIIQEIESQIPTMKADLDLLRRVLINIMTNAIKYIPDGGTIVLTVKTTEDHTVFAVSDNGPGIPPEDQPHIFELFYRGKKPRTIKGAGLGLAFCKLAVEAHGGRIWLDSELNKGTTFYFTIPHKVPEISS